MAAAVFLFVLILNAFASECWFFRRRDKSADRALAYINPAAPKPLSQLTHARSTTAADKIKHTDVFCLL